MGGGKYLFVYAFDNNPVIGELAHYIASELKLDIYSFFPAKYADKDYRYAGPCDFLKLINNASFILSNSFHATAFSLLFHKNFACMNRNFARRNGSQDSRMRDLLKASGLEERFIPDVGSDNWKHDIDWERVDARIAPLIESSQKYLHKALSL